MITFDKKDREEFIEFITQEILQDVEEVVRSKVGVVATAVEEAIKLSNAASADDDASAGAGECSEDITCENCPLSDSCPIADAEDADDAETDDEGDERDDGQPSIKITTKNLNPMQTAAIERFLEEFQNLGKKPKEKPAKK